MYINVSHRSMYVPGTQLLKAVCKRKTHCAGLHVNIAEDISALLQSKSNKNKILLPIFFKVIIIFDPLAAIRTIFLC